jgi:thioester reductase-like protein
VQIFSTVPKESLLKVTSVEADLEQPGLGLSSENHELLLTSEVSVVFHIAALVKFQEPLKIALNTNTLPVLAVLQLCEKMPQIKVKKTKNVHVWSKEVHVSNLFSVHCWPSC